MSESLRDQLLKSGLAQKLKSDAKPKPDARARREPRAAQDTRRERSEIDLAKAYALRDKHEREQRAREQREAEQRAREKKERKQKLAALLHGKALNDAGADIARHFPHAGKIRRVHVTAEQLARLNAGELAVVQQAGRFLLVARETGLAAQAIDADALVLLCEPGAVDEDGVPADLVW